MSSIVATWKFSQPGVPVAVEGLKNNGTALDAVERGIRSVELDESVTSVGYGGLPNAAGDLQLDAALMTSDGRVGSVMALEGFPAAIPIARLVLERSPHTALAGQGALQFAREHGLMPTGDPSTLLSPHAKARYEQFRKGQVEAGRHQENGGMSHTDTVGMIARDNSGIIAAGCATSGMQFKAPGRVGDSPIIGSGLYADKPGAAVASGDGDQMMRFCISFLVVERMRAGDTAEEACQVAMRRVHHADPKCQAAVTAMSATGMVGSACTYRGFHIVRWSSEPELKDTAIEEAKTVSDTMWKHSCV